MKNQCLNLKRRDDRFRGLFSNDVHRLDVLLKSLLFVFFLVLTACHGHEHHEAGQAEEHSHGEDGHSHEPDGEAGHGHESEGASEVVTLWGRETQLFVEFPVLVYDDDSPFAAHLTRISDHQPIDSGSVVVTLSGSGQPEEQFVIDRASQPGIFRPVIRPKYKGNRLVTLSLESDQANEVHELGEFSIFSTREQADAWASGGDTAEGISYLLEQQWVAPFRVEQAESRLMRPSIAAFASLTFPHDAEVEVSAPRSGRVGAVDGQFPHIGDEVLANAPLLALYLMPSQDDVDPATLDFSIVQSTIHLEGAQIDFDRVKNLADQGLVEQEQLDDARLALAEAKAELQSAKRRKNLFTQGQQLSQSKEAFQVPSPIQGTVSELHVAPGTWVGEGQKLAVVVNRNRLWLDVGVPEAYLGKLVKLSGAWFEMENMEDSFQVPAEALVSMGTEVDSSTRTLPVRFGINNDQGVLFAGMRTMARLIVDEPVVTTAVPVQALIADEGVDMVYVQTGGENFERRQVKLGIRDGRFVEILEGVSTGEWVVTKGAYAVKLASVSTESLGHGHAH